ncbi:glycosyl transferase group 1 [Xylanimonas cellulosilytica DSM 15894]|uniref:Glycosyl transferase group 1 n=1 Tax=Xylanimonas cellulosilytica (strain DSM 15894 / JCM 12276 / CECT 5975 / KCTC 9989 / LMG 20990 / NBRC 107835 / XIL07) TaxID=446471 RepID=D1BZX8_XYLCX|nr:glycosyltransferase [Xylanimonas cellulosilytica]ACZ32106.1 glycosyl transferase group 1 [Xylanimonas cellulosilytica DSM 15894]
MRTHGIVAAAAGVWPAQEVRPDDVAILRRHERVFTRLVEMAELRARQGRDTSALEWCRAAAGYASTNATGALRSTRLEAVVDEVAARAVPVIPRVERTGGRRVLHVLSDTAPIGGLTRLAERWIRHDTASESSVVVLRLAEVEEPLRQAVEVSGGQAVALDGGARVISAAGELRSLAAGYDAVICHPGLDDVILCTAFGAGYSGPPVALFNHTDHLFALMPTRLSLVVNFRTVGSTLTWVGRGYDPTSTYELPLLVPTKPSGGDRARARADLEIPPGAVVAATLARAPKFRDTAMEPRFSALVARALDEHPDLILCVVGPRPEDDPWPRLMDRFPGRIRVTGPVRDPQPYLEAADLYLDPFPFSSLTSLLEASALGLAVLSYDGHRALRRTLGIADYVSERDRPVDEAAYFRRLDELVSSAQSRQDAGEQARLVFEALTPVDLWTERVEQLYAQLQQRAALGQTVAGTPAPDAHDALVHYACALLAVEPPAPLVWRMIASTPRFDRADRRGMLARTLIVRAVRKALDLSGRPPWDGEAVLLPRPWPRTRTRSRVSVTAGSTAEATE